MSPCASKVEILYKCPVCKWAFRGSLFWRHIAKKHPGHKIDKVSLTKKQTFSKSKEGAAGEDSLSGVLTNENASAGEFTGFFRTGAFLSYIGTGGEFKVFEGATEKTSGVTFGISGGTAGGSTTTKTQKIPQAT